MVNILGHECTLKHLIGTDASCGLQAHISSSKTDSTSNKTLLCSPCSIPRPRTGVGGEGGGGSQWQGCSVPQPTISSPLEKSASPSSSRRVVIRRSTENSGQLLKSPQNSSATSRPPSCRSRDTRHTVAARHGCGHVTYSVSTAQPSKRCYVK